MEKYIAYYRKSVQRKDKFGNRVSKESDLSLEWQKRECAKFVESKGGVIISEYSEIASGTDDNRVGIAQALKECKKNDATLVVAKFSRFLRSLKFLVTIRDAKVKFISVDFPEANEFMVSMLAVVYAYQAAEISKFVKDTLRIKRERDGEWRKSNFSNSGRIKAGKTKREKHLTPDILRITDYAKSLKESGLTWLEVSMRVRQSSFNEVLPFATPEKLMRLVKRA